VALASLEGEEILIQLAERFDVHRNQITRSRSLLERAAEAFCSGNLGKPKGLSLNEMHAKIGPGCDKARRPPEIFGANRIAHFFMAFQKRIRVPICQLI
jgi:hypothetical protein